MRKGGSYEDGVLVEETKVPEPPKPTKPKEQKPDGDDAKASDQSTEEK